MTTTTRPLQQMGKQLHLMLTEGDDETLVVIVLRECHPDARGNVNPPNLVEHDGVEYALKRHWLDDAYIYGLSTRERMNDLLDDTPAE